MARPRRVGFDKKQRIAPGARGVIIGGKPAEQTAKRWQKRLTPDEARLVCEIAYHGNNRLRSELEKTSLAGMKNKQLGLIKAQITTWLGKTFAQTSKRQALEAVLAKVKAVLDKRAADLEKQNKNKSQ